MGSQLTAAHDNLTTRTQGFECEQADLLTLKNPQAEEQVSFRTVYAELAAGDADL
jgi:hypothetical protein